MTRICENCHQPYSSAGRRYCSRACRGAVTRRLWADRFWGFAQQGDGCWEWQGARDPRGYGIFRVEGKNCRAHRIAYLLTHGDLPAGLVVRHHCDNPPCVNPAHLLGGTQQDNIADRNARGRTAKGERAGFKTHPERYPSQKGERNPRAKLTRAQVDAIRRRYAAGGIGARSLAEAYGVSRSLIRFIVQGKNWTE